MIDSSLLAAAGRCCEAERAMKGKEKGMARNLPQRLLQDLGANLAQASAP